MKVRDQYLVKISNMFANLENLEDDDDDDDDDDDLDIKLTREKCYRGYGIFSQRDCRLLLFE
jgi:hypothetical protein